VIECCLKNVTANIVEEDIDLVWTGFTNPLINIFILVIDDVIEP